MTTKYGMFAERGFNGQGDPFVKKNKLDDRDIGLNFKATVGKSGKTNDATFDHKLKPLYEGEKYVDPLRVKLQQMAEGKKGTVSDTPFKMTSPMKKQTGKGDNTAVFGKIPYIPSNVEAGKKKGEIPSEPRGIFTGPTKKGTYGFNRNTISERAVKDGAPVGAKGVAGEYTYVADPVRHATRQAPEADSKDPFRPANPPKFAIAGMAGRTLSEMKKEFKGKGVAGEYEYQHQGPKPKPPPEPELANPFKPPAPAKDGYNRTFNKFPEYIADPVSLKVQKAREAREAEKKKMVTDNSWRPTAQIKSDATRSIMRMNLR